MLNSLAVRAGTEAARRIRRDGFSPDLFSRLVAAAGGPKWLVLNRLDRVLFGQWLRGRTRPMLALGSSIGSWRLACAAQGDPVAAIERFEQAYIHQRYSRRPGPSEVSAGSLGVLEALLGPGGPQEILAHPWLRLGVVTARVHRWIDGSAGLADRAVWGAAFAANVWSRRALGAFLERVVFLAPAAELALQNDGFRTRVTALTADNVLPALMASASIPGVMVAQRDPPGAPPGVYVDGGAVDYHMDVPFESADGLTLMPHFVETVTPGWLDRFVPWRRPRHVERMVLLAPAPALVARMPGGRIPDRHDFQRHAGDDAARIRYWQAVVALCQELAEEFADATRDGRIVDAMRPLGG